MKKENKRKFNIFVSILTCFIITLACLSPSFISRADGVLNNVEALGISEDTFKRSDFDYSSNGIAENDTWLSYYDTCYSNNFYASELYNSSWQPFIESNDFTKYYSYFDPVDNFVMLGGNTDDSFIVCNRNYFRVYTPVYIEPDTVYYNNAKELAFNSSGNNRSLRQWRYDTTQNIDGTQYIYVTQQNLLSSNIPMYFLDSVEWNFDSLDDLQDMKNPIASSGGVSKADIQANNLLKQGSKIYLTNNSFNVGNLLIYPVLTETQSDNLNSYKLRLTGSCTYGIQYNSGASNKCMVKDSTLQSLYGFTGNTINSVRGTLASNLGDYIDISFSLLSSGKYSMTLDQLNSHFKVSGRDKGIQPLASGLDNTYGGYTYWQAMSQSVGGQSIMGFQYFNTNDGQSMYDCVPTSAHYIIEAWVVANDVQASKPCSVIDIDLVTGEVTPIVENYASDEDIMSAMGSNTLPDGYGNYNSPVKPNDMQGAITNSANASSGGSGYGGNSTIESGAIVINNNPTINNNNNLESDGNSGLIPFLLGMIASNQKSSVNTIQDISGVNGWMSVISQTWSFIPTQIWNVLLTTFTAVIGICVVAFILSIVIRFIT